MSALRHRLAAHLRSLADAIEPEPPMAVLIRRRRREREAAALFWHVVMRLDDHVAPVAYGFAIVWLAMWLVTP